MKRVKLDPEFTPEQAASIVAYQLFGCPLEKIKDQLGNHFFQVEKFLKQSKIDENTK